MSSVICPFQIKKAGRFGHPAIFDFDRRDVGLTHADLMRAFQGILKRDAHLQNAIFIFCRGRFWVDRAAERRGGDIVEITSGRVQAEAVIHHFKIDIFFFDTRDADFKVQIAIVIIHIRAHFRGHLEFFFRHYIHLLW